MHDELGARGRMPENGIAMVVEKQVQRRDRAEQLSAKSVGRRVNRSRSAPLRQGKAAGAMYASAHTPDLGEAWGARSAFLCNRLRQCQKI